MKVKPNAWTFVFTPCLSYHLILLTCWTFANPWTVPSSFMIFMSLNTILWIKLDHIHILTRSLVDMLSLATKTKLRISHSFSCPNLLLATAPLPHPPPPSLSLLANRASLENLEPVRWWPLDLTCCHLATLWFGPCVSSDLLLSPLLNFLL